MIIECAVCVTLGRYGEAVTIINGQAVCRAHIDYALKGSLPILPDVGD